MIERMQSELVRLLRWSERYTKTDMLYLAQAGWWINLDLIVSSVISLLLSIVFANWLPPGTYGLYRYLLSISALIAAMSLAGMNTAVTQAVARGHEGVFSESIKVQLRFAPLPALVATLGAAYYFWHGNFELGIGLVGIALLTPLISVFNTYSAYLHGKRGFRQNFYFGFIINITYGVSIALAVLFLKNAAILILVNLGANALSIFWAYKKTLARYKPNNKADRAAIRYGRQLSVLTAWGTILTQLDSIFVFHFLGPIPLAVYSFATLLPERISGFFSFIGTAALPKFANYEFVCIRQTIIAKLLRVMIAAVGITFLYILAAPLLFQLLLPRYLSAIYYTQIYAPIITVLAILNVTNTILLAKRLTRELYIIGFLQPTLLVLFQLPLLFLYGIIGMLVARLVTDLVIIILELVFVFYPLGKNQE